MKNKKTEERTYTTTLIVADQPLDLSGFCELLARQIMADKNFLSKGDNTHERKIH